MFFSIAFCKLHFLVFVAKQKSESFDEMDRGEAMHYSNKEVALSCICSDNEE